jgi:uncharacterized protein YqeY
MAQLYDFIRSVWMTARKERKTDQALFLSGLYSDLNRVKKDKNLDDISDSVCVEVLLRYRNNINECLAVQRTDQLVEQLVIVEMLLPAPFTDDEIHGEIIKFINSNEAKPSIGNVMQHFKSNFIGKYDPSKLKDKVVQVLGAIK